MTALFTFPKIRASGSEYQALGGAKLYFFDSSTTDPLTVYQDRERTNPHGVFVQADAGGLFPPIFLPTTNYNVRMTDGSDGGNDYAQEVTIWTAEDQEGALDVDSLQTEFAKPQMPTEVITTDYTVTTDDLGKILSFDASGSGSIVLTLPLASAAVNGRGFRAVNTGSSGTVSIRSTGSDNINGQANELLQPNYRSIELYSNGANWIAFKQTLGAGEVTLDNLDAAALGGMIRVGWPIFHLGPIETIEDGFEFLNGDALLISEYDELFAKWGTTFGAPDGSHFNKPDMRGVGIRGLNAGRSDGFEDPDELVSGNRTKSALTGATGGDGDSYGSMQMDSVEDHEHTVTSVAFTQTNVVGDGNDHSGYNSDTPNTSGPVSGRVANETRMKNIGGHWITLASRALAGGASSSLKTILTGSGAPPNSLGNDGDYYIDTDSFPFIMIGPKASGAWPAGYQMGLGWKSDWATSTDYILNDAVYNDGSSYICKLAHTSDSTTEPGVGASWATNWDIMASAGSDGADGADGVDGTNGVDGADGAQGPAGVSVFRSLQFSSTTTEADPGNGYFRLNNADLTSATEAYIDDLDYVGADISGLLSGYANYGTSANHGELFFTDPSDNSNYRGYIITGVSSESGYTKLTITHNGGNGSFSNDAQISFNFTGTGLQGASGAGTGDVLGPASSVDGELTVFSGTTGKTIARANNTGMLKAASGVLATAAEGTDYYAPAGTDVAIADGGTGASDAATARSNLGLETVSQAEAEAGTSTTERSWTAQRVSQAISSLGGAGGGASLASVSLLNIRIAEIGGGRINIIGGIADPYADETGIDTVGSTNATYDAAGDFYCPSSSVGADQIPTMTGSTTSGVTITGTTEGGSRPGWHAGDKSNSTYWETSDGSLPDYLDVDLGSAATIATYKLRASAGPQYTPKSFTLSGSNTGAFSGEETLLDTQTSLANWTSGEEREFTISSPASFRYYRLNVTVTQSNDYVHVAEINLNIAGAVSDMTLVSNTFTADSVPTSAYVHLHIENPGTLNTDTIAEVSRDGGTTWTAATLALAGSIDGSVNIYIDESVDISGQPSGTSMKYRVRTANAADPHIHAINFSYN